MAETAVFHLLASFAPFFQQQTNLLAGVGEEIENILDEFERMKAFIQFADAKEENDPELKVWVKQVREAAYDIGDIIEKYMIRLQHHHGDAFLRKISRFVKTLKTRHQIASEIQKIKSKVVNISEGHKRYSNRVGTLEQISKSSAVNSRWYDCRGDARLLEEADLVGIEKPKSQLMGWLVRGDPRLKVFSVVGMGGLGKTTLVRKVFDDAVLNKHFQNHAWITVSESPKIEELLKDMIQQLFEEVKQPVPRAVETMDTSSLKAMINTFLRQKKYVLVFDDVWDITAWQTFRYAFPECNCGSRVMVTTRNMDLASFCSKEYHGNVYNLQPLTPKESWALFCKKTFQENSCPSYLEVLSRSILKKCEGLPLAIVAISGLLSIKDKSNVDEWERIHRSLGAELEGNDKLMSMNKILSLSYIDLPYYLKLCFLYLSIFPEDCFFGHWKLIRLWVAEGFAVVKAGMTAEEVAEGYLNELISRSLIQVAEMRIDGRVKSYRVHDLWREIIVSKSREQNIGTIASGGCRTWPEKVRRLSIHHHLENIQHTKRFTRLRSLLMFNTMDSSSMLSEIESLIDGPGLLRVFHWTCPSLEKLPNNMEKLLHLKYLSLRRTKVKIIPKTIGMLQNLETLDLKQTCVTKLPDEILKLQQLRHLLLYRYKEQDPCPSFPYVSGFKAPIDIGCLSSLQKLCSIEANHDNNGGSVLGEVGKLTQLKRLHILKVRSEDGRVLCSSLENLNNLRSLLVNTIEEDEIIDLDSLSLAPPLLRTLYLVGRLQKLPHWIPSLRHLARVCLGWNKLREDDDPLHSLQGLPNLVNLQLNQAYEGEELCFKAGGFKRLKSLWITRLEGLRWVRIEVGSMPHLEGLYIQNCELVEELPSGIEHLASIKNLELKDMSEGLIWSLGKEVQGGDYWKIEHIPKIWIGSSISGFWNGYFL